MMRDILRKEIGKVLEKVFPERSRGVDFSVSSAGSHADYSTNAAMVLGNNFRENAEKIKKELLISENFSEYFSKAETAPAGGEAGGPVFLNFRLSEEGIKRGLAYTRSSGYLLDWKKKKKKKKEERKEKISLDYLDANPTGPVHLGHARSGFYGDVLANILEFYGCKITREFYVNNAKSSLQIQSLGKTALGKGGEYKHEQLLNLLKKPAVNKMLAKTKDEKEAGFYVAGLIQKENEKFLKTKAKIKFDLFFEEESVYAKGGVKEIIEKLKKTGATYEKDGALWFKSSEFGDSEDRVIVRNTGEPTYLVPDICYHLDRLVQRKNDLVINIFGADHYGYGFRLKGALSALGIDSKKIVMLVYQMVRLIKGGKEVKMSKRKGEFVSLEELIDGVGLDAVRFFFLQRAVETHMDFDFDLARERSKKNPVYYVQYAHARACSILKKAGIRSSKSKSFDIPPSAGSPPPARQSKDFDLARAHERSLILKLIQFPEVVEDISKDYQVHRLTTYVHELAKIFTDFYENVPVIKAETEELKKLRLSLVLAARQILEKTLSLLGISAPLKM